MSLSNTPTSYGLMARILHWLTALLILTAFPLGLIAVNLPHDSAEAVATKATIFSLHKTLGVAVFFVALLRIFWALLQPSPAPVHAERKLESLTASVIHWALYISLIAVPLAGWIHHAAVEGFAPIWWPFGQTLPFVPKSELVASVATGLHWLFAMMLGGSLLLHIAGALKHAVIDRDGVLARMVTGRSAGNAKAESHKAPAVIAVAIYLFAGAGMALTSLPETPAEAPNPAAENTSAESGNWAASNGNLKISVQQMGSEVSGEFANWTADISFDDSIETGVAGQVRVGIDISSLSLGSVTKQALEPEFFDAATFPKAEFVADIIASSTGYAADGTLNLRGTAQAISLPFTLKIEGDTAEMQGEVTLDRRDFKMGASYGDEKTVGFGVKVSVNLTATRN